MSKTIVTGIFAFAAMTVMFAGPANAASPKDGKYTFINGDATLRVTLKMVDEKKNLYLYAKNADEGTAVEHSPENTTRWTLNENSGGWNFLHADNGANAVSNSDGKGTLKLRRNNAGGKGNADQLWQMKDGWQ